MKIVILDGYTTNTGDLAGNALKIRRPDGLFRTRPEELYERAKDAELLITNKTVLNGGIIRSLKS